MAEARATTVSKTTLPQPRTPGIELIVQGLANRFATTQANKEAKEKQMLTLVAQLAQVGMIGIDPKAKEGDPGTITVAGQTYKIVTNPEDVSEIRSRQLIDAHNRDNFGRRRSEPEIFRAVVDKANQIFAAPSWIQREEDERDLGVSQNKQQEAEDRISAARTRKMDELASQERSLEQLAFPGQNIPEVKIEPGDVTVNKATGVVIATIKRLGLEVLDSIIRPAFDTFKASGATIPPQSKATPSKPGTASDLLSKLGDLNPLGAKPAFAGEPGPGGSTPARGKEKAQPPFVSFGPEFNNLLKIAGLVTGGIGAGQFAKGFANPLATGGAGNIEALLAKGGNKLVTSQGARQLQSLAKFPKGVPALARFGGLAGVGVRAAGLPIVVGTILGTAAGRAIGQGVSFRGKTVDQRVAEAFSNPGLSQLSQVNPLAGLIEGLGEQFVGRRSVPGGGIAENQAAVAANQQIRNLVSGQRASEQATRLSPQSVLGRQSRFFPEDPSQSALQTIANF